MCLAAQLLKLVKKSNHRTHGGCYTAAHESQGAAPRVRRARAGQRNEAVGLIGRPPGCRRGDAEAALRRIRGVPPAAFTGPAMRAIGSDYGTMKVLFGKQSWQWGFQVTVSLESHSLTNFAKSANPPHSYTSECRRSVTFPKTRSASAVSLTARSKTKGVWPGARERRGRFGGHDKVSASRGGARRATGKREDRTRRMDGGDGTVTAVTTPARVLPLAGCSAVQDPPSSSYSPSLLFSHGNPSGARRRGRANAL